ncbi:MAG: DNA-binding response regulator [Bacteroidota bacterium]
MERPPRPTVVVVEDEAIIARDLQRTLTRAGYRVPGTAATADDALALVETHAPDLVFVDIVLRGERDGLWLGRVLREEHSVALLYLTSHADRRTVEQARQTRPNGYLVKPFTAEGVFAAAEAALANYAEEQRALDFAAVAEAAAGGPGGMPASALRRVEDHVAKHFDEALSLADLAAVAGMSPFHFAHCFKATVGLAPYQYVVQQRIEEAKRLLRHTDWLVSDVAAAVGYESQGHFTTLFKREVGVPPGRYRRLQ